MDTLSSRSDLARDTLSVYRLIAWIVLGIGLVVTVVLLAALFRYRARPGAPLPRQVRGHTLLEIAWTIAPGLIILAIAIPSIRVIFRTQGPAPPGALEVTVVSRQWWWEFRYPSLGVVTANELHLPAGRAVLLRLEGVDVIHSFWVPRLGGKRDIFPGNHNTIVLTPDTPGEYWGQCAEFCGTSHANMRLRVFVDPPDGFARWTAAQLAPAVEVAVGPAADGRQIFSRSACVGCHTVRGVSSGLVGPDLTHFGSRTTFAAGLFPNLADRVAEWVRDAPALKAGVKMPNLGLTDGQARAVAAYLESLK
jgi:cytochrome c oxidase subunit II